MAQKTIVAKEGQTIFDLSLQLYGDVSKVFDLITLNGIESISTPLQGKTIVYEDPLNEVSEFYKNTTLSNRYPEKDSGVYFLKQENGFYLLQENGFKIKI